MKTSRQEVYAAIDTERAYQDKQWPSAEWSGDNNVSPNALSIGEFILLMEEYASQARYSWTREKRPEMNALNIVRKIAGIAVNCMEQHGAPKRIP